jgi:hypothetical protein
MFRHDGNAVFLDGLRVPLEIFFRLEPAYQYPNDLVTMFYDGVRRHYRTHHRSWNVIGKWEDGDRYLGRISEFSRLVAEDNNENLEVEAAVEEAKRLAEPDIKAKYPEEDTPNVELQQRNDLKPKRTKRVRASGERSPRSGDQHSG